VPRCWCLATPPPKTLHGQFYAAIDRAACLGTTGFTFTWEWNAGVPRWVGTVKVTGGNGVEITFVFTLACSTALSHETDWPGHNWVLGMQINDGDCCVVNEALCESAVALQSSTCDPLNLVFGPYGLTIGDLACFLCYNPGSAPNTGSFYLVVTL